MLSTIILGEVVAIITTIFSLFPPVETLPTIAGVDLDSVIIGGIGNVVALSHVFWYITDVIQGFLFIAGYFMLKMTLKSVGKALQTFGGAAIS